ncbi:unnamed protein product [Blepharisma stoltei]|uniref:Uncharacterized protein n=1 Tax=Blepharisma stoltei TaxID=1481888 RepID=A0AAU9IBK4_9CILI|nr:unnamed protein product [Blepharisma stoltei]
MGIELCQILDKEFDQNEIESTYLWDFDSYAAQTLSRIDLSTLAVDFSRANPILIKYSMSLPKNQMLGIYNKEDLQYLFIADENFNIEIIDSCSTSSYVHYCFTSCFYDDAIFIFEGEIDFSQGGIISQHAKKYLISQNKWVYLSEPLCYSPYSCTGINQKIIIADNGPYLWVYDIFLDSYSSTFIKYFDKKAEQILVKVSGKIYLIVFHT